MKHKLLLSLMASVLVFFGMASVSASADEITVTGNGAESESTVQSTTTSDTSIQQSNTAEINNTITTTSNTGNNEASNNTGDSTIITGNASSTTGIVNQVNSSVVNADCCMESGNNSVTVSGNGTDSNNTIVPSNNNQSNVVTNQSANIQNTINANLNTGYNTASGNLGNVSIRTGNISAYQLITNGPVNFARINLGTANDIYSVLINGNGVGSQNNVFLTRDMINSILVNNSAVFINDTTLLLNTGGNIASVNVGNVDIKTGDIISRTVITNIANVSDVSIVCCEKPEDKNQPENPTSVSSPNNPTSSGGGSTQGSSGSAGQVLGSVLPTTGGNWAVIFLIGNMLMLLMGAFLRLRSGRSPSYILAS